MILAKAVSSIYGHCTLGPGPYMSELGPLARTLVLAGSQTPHSLYPKLYNWGSRHTRTIAGQQNNNYKPVQRIDVVHYQCLVLAHASGRDDSDRQVQIPRFYQLQPP